MPKVYREGGSKFDTLAQLLSSMRSNTMTTCRFFVLLGLSKDISGFGASPSGDSDNKGVPDLQPALHSERCFTDLPPGSRTCQMLRSECASGVGQCVSDANATRNADAIYQTVRTDNPVLPPCPACPVPCPTGAPNPADRYIRSARGEVQHINCAGAVC